MGISMRALRITDDEIRDFKKRPRKLEALRNRKIPDFKSNDCCDLHDFWCGIHFVLTRGPGGGALPWGALRVGDVMYTKDVSDPAHAIYSATAGALVQQIDALSDSTAMLDAGVYPGRLWLPPAEGSFNDLKGYLRSLRDFARAAVAENKGLVFCRYEDL
jgi:hypothetical protein